MRDISPTGHDLAARPDQRLAWLVELTAGDWVWRAATRTLSTSGVDWPGRLADVRWSEALTPDAMPGGLARARATLRVLEPPGAADGLKAKLATTDPIGVEAKLVQLWLEANAPPSLSEAAVLLHGRLVDARLRPGGVDLELADGLGVLAERRIGRMMRPGMIAGDPPETGRPLPWIFGRVEDAELVALDGGTATRLAAHLEPEAAVVPVDSTGGFPSRGRVQVGGEVLEYPALDPDAGTLGTPTQPVLRTEPAEHNSGADVRLVPEGGFRWLVADHPCQAVESVRADGAGVSGWNAPIEPIGQHDAQLVALDRWPLDAGGRQAHRLTATVQGYHDPWHEVPYPENPADVVWHLLSAPRLGGIPEHRLSDLYFDQARDRLAERGARHARRLAGGEHLLEVLESAAAEAGLWIINAGWHYRVLPAHPTPHPADAVAELDEHSALEADRAAAVTTPGGALRPDAIELVGAGGSLQLPPETVASGDLPRRFRVDWLDLASGPAAGDLGEAIWMRLAEAPFTYEQNWTPGRTLLLAGEVVRLTAPALELNEIPAWITRVALEQPGRVRLTLRGTWAGEYLARADADNYLRRNAFGNLVDIVLAGRPVARLRRDGTLRLAGCLREGAALAAGPFSEPVAFEGGHVYLATGSGETWTPFLRLDADGDAALAGAVREQSTLAMDPAGEGLGADADRFWLSPDASTGAFEFRADAGRLHLKNILIESAWL